MPVLKPKEEPQKIILPSSKPKDEAWVLVDGDMRGRNLLNTKAENKEDAALGILVTMIIDWNFTDVNGQKAEINIANVGLLSLADTEYIFTSTGLSKKLEALSQKKS